MERKALRERHQNRVPASKAKIVARQNEDKKIEQNQTSKKLIKNASISQLIVVTV